MVNYEKAFEAQMCLKQLQVLPQTRAQNARGQRRKALPQDIPANKLKHSNAKHGLPNGHLRMCLTLWKA